MTLLKSVHLKGDKGCFSTRKFNCNIKINGLHHFKVLEIWVGVSSDAILLVSSVAFGYTLWHILLPIRFNFQPDGLRNR